MGVKLELSHNDNQIQFFNKEFGIMGFTDYTHVIWEELSKVNWYVNETKFLENEKTYIYTGSSLFGARKDLHQIIMKLWYGEDAIDVAYAKNFIIEHHNNKAFDCQIHNLSFASNDLNLTKAHSFDKTQPKLIKRAAVNFYKDFKTQQFQISLFFTDDFAITYKETSILIERLWLLYEDNFRVVYTDANRIVDELLEVGNINFKLLSFKKASFKKAEFYVDDNGQDVKGIQFIENEQGQMILVVGNDSKEKFYMNSILPNTELYKEDE